MSESILPFSEWANQNSSVTDPVQRIKEYSGYARKEFFKSGTYNPEVESGILAGIDSRLREAGITPEDPTEKEALRSKLFSAQNNVDNDAQFLYDASMFAGVNDKPVLAEEDETIVSRYVASKKLGLTEQADQYRPEIERIVTNRKAVSDAKRRALARGDVNAVAIEDDNGNRSVISGPDATRDLVSGNLDSLISRGAIAPEDIPDLAAEFEVTPFGATRAEMRRYDEFAKVFAELATPDGDIRRSLNGEIEAARAADNAEMEEISTENIARAVEAGGGFMTPASVAGERILGGVKDAIGSVVDVAGDAVMTAKALATGDLDKLSMERLAAEERKKFTPLVEAIKDTAIGSEFSDDEIARFTKDFVREYKQPTYRTDRAGSGIEILSSGMPVVAQELAVRPDLLEKQITSAKLNEAQAAAARLQGSKMLEKTAQPTIQFLLKQDTDVVSAYAEAKEQGKTDSEFVTDWMANEENYDNFKNRSKSFGVAAIRAVAEPIMSVPALFGNEQAAKSLVGMSKAGEQYSQYATMFGDRFGVGQQLAELAPSVAVDILASIGTAGSYNAAKGAASAAAKGVSTKLFTRAASSALSNLDEATRVAATAGASSSTAASTGLKSVADAMGRGAIQAGRFTEDLIKVGPASFLRSAGATYGSLYGQLPDTMSHEEKHKAAYGYAISAGAFTAVLTAGMTRLGLGGTENLATKNVDELSFNQIKRLFSETRKAAGAVTDAEIKKAVRTATAGAYKQFVKGNIKGFASEGFEEGVDQAFQVMVEDAALNRDTPIRELGSQIFDSFVLGGLTGSISNVIERATPAKQETVDLARRQLYTSITDKLTGTGSPKTAAALAQVFSDATAPKPAATPAAAEPAEPATFDVNAVVEDWEPVSKDTGLLADYEDMLVWANDTQGILKRNDKGEMVLEFTKPAKTGETKLVLGRPETLASGILSRNFRMRILNKDDGTAKAGAPVVKRLNGYAALPHADTGFKPLIVRNPKGQPVGLAFPEAKMVGADTLIPNLLVTSKDPIYDIARYYGVDFANADSTAMPSYTPVKKEKAVPNELAGTLIPESVWTNLVSPRTAAILDTGSVEGFSDADVEDALSDLFDRALAATASGDADARQTLIEAHSDLESQLAMRSGSVIKPQTDFVTMSDADVETLRTSVFEFPLTFRAMVDGKIALCSYEKYSRGAANVIAEVNGSPDVVALKDIDRGAFPILNPQWTIDLGRLSTPIDLGPAPLPVYIEGFTMGDEPVTETPVTETPVTETPVTETPTKGRKKAAPAPAPAPALVPAPAPAPAPAVAEPTADVTVELLTTLGVKMPKAVIEDIKQAVDEYGTPLSELESIVADGNTAGIAIVNEIGKRASSRAVSSAVDTLSSIMESPVVDGGGNTVPLAVLLTSADPVDAETKGAAAKAAKKKVAAATKVLQDSNVDAPAGMRLAELVGPSVGAETEIKSNVNYNTPELRDKFRTKGEEESFKDLVFMGYPYTDLRGIGGVNVFSPTAVVDGVKYDASPNTYFAGKRILLAQKIRSSHPVSFKGATVMRRSSRIKWNPFTEDGETITNKSPEYAPVFVNADGDAVFTNDPACTQAQMELGLTVVVPNDFDLMLVNSSMLVKEVGGVRYVAGVNYAQKESDKVKATTTNLKNVNNAMELSILFGGVSSSAINANNLKLEGFRDNKRTFRTVMNHAIRFFDKKAESSSMRHGSSMLSDIVSDSKLRFASELITYGAGFDLMQFVARAAEGELKRAGVPIVARPTGEVTMRYLSESGAEVTQEQELYVDVEGVPQMFNDIATMRKMLKDGKLRKYVTADAVLKLTVEKNQKILADHILKLHPELERVRTVKMFKGDERSSAILVEYGLLLLDQATDVNTAKPSLGRVWEETFKRHMADRSGSKVGGWTNSLDQMIEESGKTDPFDTTIGGSPFAADLDALVDYNSLDFDENSRLEDELYAGQRVRDAFVKSLEKSGKLKVAMLDFGRKLLPNLFENVSVTDVSPTVLLDNISLSLDGLKMNSANDRRKLRIIHELPETQEGTLMRVMLVQLGWIPPTAHSPAIAPTVKEINKASFALTANEADVARARAEALRMSEDLDEKELTDYDARMTAALTSPIGKQFMELRDSITKAQRSIRYVDEEIKFYKRMTWIMRGSDQGRKSKQLTDVVDSLKAERDSLQKHRNRLDTQLKRQLPEDVSKRVSEIRDEVTSQLNRKIASLDIVHSLTSESVATTLENLTRARVTLQEKEVAARTTFEESVMLFAPTQSATTIPEPGTRTPVSVTPTAQRIVEQKTSDLRAQQREATARTDAAQKELSAAEESLSAYVAPKRRTKKVQELLAKLQQDVDVALSKWNAARAEEDSITSQLRAQASPRRTLYSVSLEEHLVTSVNAARNAAEIKAIGLDKSPTAALQHIAKNGAPHLRVMARLLLDNQAAWSSIPVVIDEINPSIAGAYYGSGIVINLNGSNGHGVADVLVHELTHALTASALVDPKVAQRIEQLRTLALRNIKFMNPRIEYAFSSNEEFVAAAFTDPDVQYALRTAEAKGGRSWLRRMFDAVASFFGRRDAVNAFEELTSFARMAADDLVFGSHAARTYATAQLRAARTGQALERAAANSMAQTLEDSVTDKPVASETPFELGARVRAIVPASFTLIPDSGMRGAFGMQSSGVMTYNPALVASSIDDVDTDIADAILNSMVSHEIAHFAANSVMNPADYVDIATELGEETLAEFANKLYSLAYPDTEARAAQIAQDRAEGLLTDADIAAEWVRSQVERAALGKSSEEVIHSLLGNESLIARIVEYIRAFIGKLSKRQAENYSLKVAASISRASRVMEQLLNGGITPAAIEAQMDVGHAVEFFNAVQNGTISQTHFIMPIRHAAKAGASNSIWSRIAKLVRNLPPDLHRIIRNREGKLNQSRFTMERFVPHYKRHLEAALKAGADINDVGMILGNTAPTMDEAAIARVRVALDAFRRTIPKRATDAVEQIEAEKIRLFEIEKKKQDTGFRAQQVLATERVAAVAPEFVTFLQQFRKQIDDHQINIGYGDSAGIYLTRTYNYFNTKGWSDAARNGGTYRYGGEEIDFDMLRGVAAMAYEDEIRARYAKEGKPLPQEVLRDECFAALDELLAWLDDNATNDKGESISLDTRRFMAKTNHDPRIRELIGEVTNPLENAVRTFFYVSMLDTNKQSLSSIRDSLLASGVGTTEELNGYVQVFGKGGSETMAPLAGVYVRADVAKELEAEFGSSARKLMRHTEATLSQSAAMLAKASGAAMTAKTLLNVGFYTRNILSNQFVLLARQGVIPSDPRSRIGRAYKLSWVANFESLGKDAQPEDIAEIEKLTRLQVIRDSSSRGNFDDMLRGYADRAGTTLETVVDKLSRASQDRDVSSVYEMLEHMAKLTGKTVDVLAAFNSLFDDSAKLQLFYFERGKLAEAYPDNDADWLDEQAATKVKLTMPGHSQQIDAVRSFNRHPFALIVFPFARWKTEVIRTLINTYKLGVQEMRSGNSVMRNRGFTRMASCSGVVTLGGALAGRALGAAFGWFTGLGDDEEEVIDDPATLAAMRVMFPEWQRGKSIRVTSTGRELRVIDMSSIMPDAVVNDLWTITREGYASKNEFDAKGIVGYIAKQYVGSQIASGAVNELLNNRDTFDRPIYEETDSVAAASYKAFVHVASQAYKPGVITKIQQSTREGEQNPGYIWAGEFLGARPQVIPLDRAAISGFYELKSQFDSAKRARTPLNAGRFISDEDLRETMIKAQTYEDRAQGALHRYTKALRELGMTDRDILYRSKPTGMSRKRVQEAMAGINVVWMGNSEWNEGMARNVESANEDDPRRRYELMMEVKRELGSVVDVTNP